jgi:hypothetical protein
MIELTTLRAIEVILAFEERTRIDEVGSDPETEEFVAEIIVCFDRFLRRPGSACRGKAIVHVASSCRTGTEVSIVASNPQRRLFKESPPR